LGIEDHPALKLKDVDSLSPKGAQRGVVPEAGSESAYGCFFSLFVVDKRFFPFSAEEEGIYPVSFWLNGRRSGDALFDPPYGLSVIFPFPSLIRRALWLRALSRSAGGRWPVFFSIAGGAPSFPAGGSPPALTGDRGFATPRKVVFNSLFNSFASSLRPLITALRVLVICFPRCD